MDDHYKIGAVARQLDMSTAGVRKWASDYADFLSSTGAPRSGSERHFTEEDVELLQQVARLRSQGYPHDEIKRILSQTAQEAPGDQEAAPTYKMTYADENAAPAPSTRVDSDLERLLPLLLSARQPEPTRTSSQWPLLVAFLAGAGVMAVAVLLALLILRLAGS